MFDTENILGHLVLAELKKTAQELRRNSYLPRIIGRGGKRVQDAEADRLAQMGELDERRQNRRNQRETARAQSREIAETREAARQERLQRMHQGVHNRMQARQQQKPAVGAMPRGATQSIQGAAINFEKVRSSPEYKSRLAKQYELAGHTAPAWTQNTNADTVQANADVQQTAQNDAAVSFNPPADGGGGSGMQPGGPSSGASGSTPTTGPNMTTTSTTDTGTPQIGNTSSNPRIGGST